MLLRCKKTQKPRWTISRFSQIFIELLCGPKSNLDPLHENLSNGVANPEILYLEEWKTELHKEKIGDLGEKGVFETHL